MADYKKKPQIDNETPVTQDDFNAKITEMEKNANLLPDGIFEFGGVTIASGKTKFTVRPKYAGKFTPTAKPGETTTPKPIAYQLANAVVVKAPGKRDDKTGLVSAEISILDFGRLLANMKKDPKWINLYNTLLIEEQASANAVAPMTAAE